MTSGEKKFIKILLIILCILIIIAIIKNIRRKSNNNNVEFVDISNEIATDNENTSEVADGNSIEENTRLLANGTKLNKSEQLNQVKEIDGVKFENIQLTNNSGQTVLLANVTNTTNEATEMQFVDVIVLDKSGSEIGKISGVIAPLGSGESKQFNASTTVNYINAYDFKIVKK